MKLVCQICERMFDSNPNAKCRAKFCPSCAAERQRESKRKNYQREKAGYVPAELGYILVHDPEEEAALLPGLRISLIEHDEMVKHQSYTPGTIIRQGDERKRIDLVNGRMVEVRI